MREPTLQSLIKKHKKRIKTLRETQVGYDYPDMQAYYDWVEISKRYLKLHFPGDQSVVEFCKLSEERISRDQQEKLLSILNAFVVIPQIIRNNIQMEKEGTKVNVTVNNNNSQSQNQYVILERDKELLKPRSGIMAKLKEICIAVVTGILVDVLSNPHVWRWLHYHLELILGCILL